MLPNILEAFLFLNNYLCIIMTRKQLIIKILFFLLSSAMGLLFIYSGWAKLEPIEPFEFTFVDLGVSGWRTAPFVARFMIGLEFFIGFLLIFGIFIKRFTINLTVGARFENV